MAIFTNNTARIEAPNNTALAIELSKRIGEANPGKAIASALNGWARDVHDYTYGTAMGIANDIKAARDEFGNLKDADGRFVNDNDKVRTLLAGRNPSWTANNYADANMEDWYKGRDQEGRSIEQLILSKAAGDRDQQRVNLALRTYADTRGDIKRSRENTDLFNQFNRLYQIDPEAAKQWYRDNKEKLNSPEYADANTLILALTAKAGTSTQTSPGADIPNDYAITPEEYTPAKTLLHNELASQGAAVPFIQSMIKGTVQPYSEADKGLLDTVKNDPDKYNKLLGSINEAKDKLKAAGIPEDIAAYVLQNASRSTFFNGIEFNHDALIAEADAIRKSAQDNGTKIRKLLQYDKVLGDDSNYLSNQVAARDQRFRVIDRALAEGDITSPELANEVKKKADSDLYSNTRDKQSILSATKRARETSAAVAAAMAKEKAGIEELARMRQEASSIKDPTKRAVWLANIDRKYKALSESTAKAKADADRAKQMLYDLNLGF